MGLQRVGQDWVTELSCLSLPCKDIARRWPPASQGMTLHQEQNQPAPWSWTSQPPQLWECKLLFKPLSLWCFKAALADNKPPSSQNHHQLVKSFPLPTTKTWSQNTLPLREQKPPIFTDEMTLHFNAILYSLIHLDFGARTNKGMEKTWRKEQRKGLQSTRTPRLSQTSLPALVSSSARGGKWDGYAFPQMFSTEHGPLRSPW